MKGLAEALGAHGLATRGGFVFAGNEAAPPGPSGAPARTVILVGHGGGTIWPHFSAWMAGLPDQPANPLDEWSKQVLDAIANDFGARAVYPFEKPWLPFQQWAVRAEGLKPSPLGILMHPEFGLWHAYRGALLLDAEIGVQAVGTPIHLCDLCDGKPCMNSCPAGAVTGQGFDVAGCAGYLTAGGDCGTVGCHARAACPHDAYRYGPEQTGFHMGARLHGLEVSEKNFGPDPRKARNASS